jgi:hypothetical protein
MIKKDDYRGLFSMLEKFVQDGEWNDLRETYFKKIALPEIKKLDKTPKTVQDAYLILKQLLEEEVKQKSFYE